MVESADKGKGYEVDKGVYLMIDDEEIEAIAIESNHTIEIDRFVPKAQSRSARNLKLIQSRVFESVVARIGATPSEGGLPPFDEVIGPLVRASH